MSQNYRNFITGSKHIGEYDEIRDCMDGFGIYYYPDGSEYRGYFKDGQFNGYGRLYLSAPYKFTFTGHFENGRLMEIEEMIFDDGLRVKGEFDGHELQLDDWRYCQEEDRRYSTEIPHGPEPVDKNSHDTRVLPPRPIPKNCYDTEEGIFHANSGFLLNRPPPVSKSRFIGCNDELEIVKAKFRKAPHFSIAAPFYDFDKNSHSIINTNINDNPSLTSKQKSYGNRISLKLPLMKQFDDSKSEEIEEIKSIKSIENETEIKTSIKKDDLAGLSVESETESSCYDKEYDEANYEDESKGEEENFDLTDWQSSESNYCQCRSQEIQTCNKDDILRYSSCSSSVQSFDIENFLQNVQKQFQKDWLRPSKDQKQELDMQESDLMSSLHHDSFLREVLEKVQSKRDNRKKQDTSDGSFDLNALPSRQSDASRQSQESHQSRSSRHGEAV